MSRKRKRLKKLLMALFPRDDAEFYINVGLICDLDYAAQIRAVKDGIKKREEHAQAGMQTGKEHSR